MASLHMEAGRQLANTQQLLQQLVSVPGDPIKENQVRENLMQLEQDVSRLLVLARKEAPSQRQEALRRVDQLSADFEELQRAHKSYQRRKSEAELEAHQRQELLSRRYTANVGREDTSIPLEHSLHHHQSLGQANAELDSLIDHGSAVMSSLHSQKSLFKVAHRKVLDLTSTLGLSNTVMRFIERRTEQDRYIFWTGLVITTFFICLLIYYFIL